MSNKHTRRAEIHRRQQRREQRIKQRTHDAIAKKK
jgi:hypothetical protein